jgi:hypothetical protein
MLCALAVSGCSDTAPVSCATVSRADYFWKDKSVEVPLTPKEARLIRKSIHRQPPPPRGVVVDADPFPGRGDYLIEAGDKDLLVHSNFEVFGWDEVTRNQAAVSRLFRRLVETYEDRIGHKPWKTYENMAFTADGKYRKAKKRK